MGRNTAGRPYSPYWDKRKPEVVIDVNLDGLLKEVASIPQMNGIEGYGQGVKAVCDRIKALMDELESLRTWTPAIQIENVISRLEQIRKQFNVDNNSTPAP